MFFLFYNECMCFHPTGYIWPKEKTYCEDCSTYNSNGLGWVCNCVLCNCEIELPKKEKIIKTKFHFPTFKEWSKVQKERTSALTNVQ